MLKLNFSALLFILTLSLLFLLPLYTVLVTFEKRPEVSCDTFSGSLRCTERGQDLAEQGHIYWCELCGSSMMKRSGREGWDPSEQVTFLPDRQKQREAERREDAAALSDADIWTLECVDLLRRDHPPEYQWSLLSVTVSLCHILCCYTPTLTLPLSMVKSQ